MPPKAKGGKKKKKEKVVAPPPFPIPRSLAESCPIDAYEGALGIDHHDVRSRIRNVQADLALWKIAEAIRDGELELELSDHGLDTLPEELFDLSWLQIIDLSKNFFVTSVFEQLAYLPNLRTLDLSTNLLNGPMPEAVGRLSPALEELSIDENVLTALHPAAASLSQLVWLSARRNLLTEIPPPCLSAWNKLEYLDLRNNKLTSLPVEIGACISLQSLFLSENELTSLPDSIGELSALQLLHVQKNALVTLPETLAGCTALQELDVSFNKLTVLPAAVCSSMLHMVTFAAAANKIDAVPAEMAAMTELEVLNLASNNIKTLPEELGSLSKLREVYFNANPLTALPASIAGWHRLEEGSFKNCKLKALPGEVAATWKNVRVLDVRAKKKDTCKVAPDVKDTLRKCRMMGVVLTKPKKSKGKK